MSLVMSDYRTAANHRSYRQIYRLMHTFYTLNTCLQGWWWWWPFWQSSAHTGRLADTTFLLYSSIHTWTHPESFTLLITFEIRMKTRIRHFTAWGPAATATTPGHAVVSRIHPGDGENSLFWDLQVPTTSHKTAANWRTAATSQRGWRSPVGPVQRERERNTHSATTIIHSVCVCVHETWMMSTWIIDADSQPTLIFHSRVAVVVVSPGQNEFRNHQRLPPHTHTHTPRPCTRAHSHFLHLLLVTSVGSDMQRTTCLVL